MKLSFRHRRVERGVALVITLVLLSVITFMAIAFLVLSRAERGAVTTATDQAMAKLAADAGLERAKAELLAPMMAFRNPFTYDLLVSTNYINPRGFVSTGNPLQDGSYTNVSWVYPNGNPLNANDSLQNLANLFYSPRVPVYVNVLSNGVRVPEFRYYLDLNRNRDLTDDTNGVFSSAAGPSSGFYQSFTNVELFYTNTLGEQRALVDLNCYRYRDLPHLNASCRSFWEGKISLGGTEWQVGRVEDLSAPGSELREPFLLLRPWSERQKPFFLQDGSLDAFAAGRNLYLDGAGTSEAAYYGTTLAPYQGSGGVQIYNGVISGPGGIIQRAL